MHGRSSLCSEVHHGPKKNTPCLGLMTFLIVGKVPNALALWISCLATTESGLM